MNVQCSICLQEIININTCVTNCHHRYCVDCLNRWFDRGQSSCPLCRGTVRYITHDNQSHRIIFNRLDNQHIQSQPHVQSQGNNVLITKQFYRFIKLSYVLMSFLSTLPVLMYIKIRKEYSDQNILLEECHNGS